METETSITDATANTATPDFQFSFIECLMYALHQLSRKYPDFLIAEENEERVKDFRLRYSTSDGSRAFDHSSPVDYAISTVEHLRTPLN